MIWCMVVWNTLQYGHSRSAYSITFTVASGLPKMWSAEVTGGKLMACAVPLLGAGAVPDLPTKNTAPAISKPATTIVMGKMYCFIFLMDYAVSLPQAFGLKSTRILD